MTLLPLEQVSDRQINDWHVCGLLDEAVENYADHPFLVGAETLTYRQAAEQVHRVATWLAKRAVTHEDRVILLARNRVEVVVTSLAVARLGAIFIPLNPEIKPYGLRQIVQQVSPVIVVLDKTTAKLAEVIPGALVICLDADATPPGGIAFAELLRSPVEQQPFPGSASDPVALIYTSGSTSVPRGVVVTHDNIRFSARAIQERLGYQTEDVIGLFLPLSFDYGLYQVFLAAQVGATILLNHPEAVGPELVALLEIHQVSVLPVVPTLLGALIKLMERRPRPLPHLRCLTSTGERLPGTYVECILKYFPAVNIFPMYGLTECKRVSILLPPEMIDRPDSVGRPLPGTEAYVVDEAGQPLPVGIVGELVVRGRHVTQGYWGATEETAARFRSVPNNSLRELYTGDLCQVDAEGFIYFMGRRDSWLKHRGFRVSPAEIETAADDIPGVLGAGVVQLDNNDHLHLFVTVADPALTNSQIVGGLRERLEAFKIPEGVHIVESLPLNQRGKLDRGRLKKIVAEGQF